MAQQITIGHLYPDQMNIYGDRGNILTLSQRCTWRGISAVVRPIGVSADIDWSSLDILFFGGGQDSGQALIADDLVKRHSSSLSAAITDGIVMLAICGGYQLLGDYFLTHTGEKLPGIGALDLHTVGGRERMIGNIVVQANGLEQDGVRNLRLVGFENHSGQTFLGSGVRPLGKVLSGHGNNGHDGTEGAIFHNTIGCYMHGSLLPKNPQLADDLIRRALLRRYGYADLAPLNDAQELRAQETMIERVVGV